MDYRNWAEDTMAQIVAKLEKTAPKIGASFPHKAENGEYDNETASWWTNGFWPGILWLAYIETGNGMFSDIAEKIEEKLDAVLDGFDKVDHDAGFIWLLSAGANYSLTGNKNSRTRILKAASFLSSRFNCNGGYIRAWNAKEAEGYAIIDCCMNLPLLYRASQELDDPRFALIAREHLKTVMKYFVEEDGSVRHIVSFDTETGEYIEALGGQGAAKDSAWSRGASWAIYGLALAYKYYKDEKMLALSKRVANFFLANLPEDMVAHWDFRVKRDEKTPRDTSAAACAACGLLELADIIGGAEGDNYKEKAFLILDSLTKNYSNLKNDNADALLNGATMNAPRNCGINVSLIYADYFYTEAVSRLKGNKRIFWYCD